MEFLRELDTSIFYVVNVDLKNSFFDIIMPFVTNLNNWFIIIGVFVACILYIDTKKAIKTIIIAVIAVSISDLVNHNILKEFFGRVRPCNVLEGINVMAGCTGSYAFPSSHASNIFALCVVISYQFIKFSYVMIPIAFLVCYSRVYLGVHYPLDVIVGAVSGSTYAIALIMLNIQREKMGLGINLKYFKKGVD